MEQNEVIQNSIRTKQRILEQLEEDYLISCRNFERKNNELYDIKARLLKISEEKCQIAYQYLQKQNSDNTEAISLLNHFSSNVYNEIISSFMKHQKNLEEKQSQIEDEYKKRQYVLGKGIDELYFKQRELNSHTQELKGE